MTGGLLLAGYAVAAGFCVPAALRRGWAWREPRVAITLRLALAVSWLIAVPLAVVALAMPSVLTWSPGGRDPVALAAGLALASGFAVADAFVFAAGFAGWACWQMARGLLVARRGRRAFAASLAGSGSGSGSGRADPATGAVIIDDDKPGAYCLPAGRRPLIVVSAGAVARLTPPQLQAVLAHERAHLRGRHHLLLTAAAALGRAFPFVPLLGDAAADLSVLAEMAADDAAVRRHSRVDLAGALVALAGAEAGGGALAAGGHAAIARVGRLLAPAPPSGVAARSARVIAVAIPAMVSCLPLVLIACGVFA